MLTLYDLEVLDEWISSVWPKFWFKKKRKDHWKKFPMSSASMSW